MLKLKWTNVNSCPCVGQKRGGKKEQCKHNLSLLFTQKKLLFPGFILRTTLPQLLPRMWNKTKALNQSHSHTGHFICMHWQGRVQVHLKETQSWRGQGEADRVGCNNCCGNNKVGALISDVVRSPSVKASVHTKNDAKGNKLWGGFCGKIETQTRRAGGSCFTLLLCDNLSTFTVCYSTA